jgi:3-hydroxyacyl-CoA dehydrogenase/enoyl-CoA hydratase/3-hydroxybutyryl-CoA epimerase
MPDHRIRLFTDNNIAFCELTDPPGNVMNGLFFERFSSLAGSFRALDVAGMIVRSSGRHFSSGADLDELQKIVGRSPGRTASDLLARNHAAFESLAGLEYPVVASIAGCCLGAALELALACDYRVCAPNAVFALPESTFGFMPGCGGTVRLPALIGPAKAMALTLSGQTLGPAEALECGLVDMVVDKRNLLSTSLRFIERSGSKRFRPQAAVAPA